MDLLGSYVDIFFHTAASIIIAFFVANFYKKTRKNLLLCIVFSLLGGLFIDLDHIIDNVLAFGFTFNYHDFVKGTYFLTGKHYIFFHAFEYVFIFWALGLWAKGVRKMIFQVVALSMFVHLLIDITLFSIPIKQYFITYRMYIDFKNIQLAEQPFWTFNLRQILQGL